MLPPHCVEKLCLKDVDVLTIVEMEGRTRRLSTSELQTILLWRRGSKAPDHAGRSQFSILTVSTQIRPWILYHLRKKVLLPTTFHESRRARRDSCGTMDVLNLIWPMDMYVYCSLGSRSRNLAKSTAVMDFWCVADTVQYVVGIIYFGSGLDGYSDK